MKNIPTYDQFILCESMKDTYVGVHCSPYGISHDDFCGPITDEYHHAFEQVLKAVQRDYPEAKALLKKVASVDGLSLTDDTVDLVFEIAEFLADNHLEWIFVSDSPLTKYGSNCYRVYFKDLKRVYILPDEMTDGARIYVYNSKKDRPTLSPA